ncbi:biotin-dependent carboxyltransferase family protein [Algoriphagus sediminis]|uniref:Biotin-dependent carboxyltransferase family protein n=1 Tax=Algoriphagus sediminis TaxID=3057113 RepID=A0ABT7YB52_9BACT|nr:biotin-dependent carboxyltransferase family protein [Algoriphagus sediminis]MDN3203747.1 biotin-dependent carboxyltransferase family protein [Algoriphagus sediminis]
MIKDLGNAKILSTGPQSLIRDLGRFGYFSIGVPVSGPLDHKAFQWNNHLLRNDPNDSQIEINQPGLKIQFDSDTWISLAGAKCDVKVNGSGTKYFGPIKIKAGDILSFGNFELGSLIYMGISEGFQTEKVLGSRSQLQCITSSSSLNKGDLLPFFTNSTPVPSNRFAKAKWDTEYLEKTEIRVYPGFDWNHEIEKILDPAFKERLHISKLKNTMAAQLEEVFPNDISPIATAPVFPGSIQLTPSGKLICLLSDAQVTGGYPRVLQIHEEDISILAQKKPGQEVRFEKLGV